MADVKDEKTKEDEKLAKEEEAKEKEKNAKGVHEVDGTMYRDGKIVDNAFEPRLPDDFPGKDVGGGGTPEDVSGTQPSPEQETAEWEAHLAPQYVDPKGEGTTARPVLNREGRI